MAKRKRTLENMGMNYRQIFTDCYKGKKVLVTGHTGFKGSWLLAWLHQLGAIVKGYALAPQDDNELYCLAGGDKLCESVIGDIRNREKLFETITGFQPEFIFHLAAQPLVRRSYEMPVYTFEVNVNGTLNLLEAVRNTGSRCNVVIVTTDKVYENLETNHAYQETDKLGGYDPYSASKAAAEIVVNSYRNSFFGAGNFDKHMKSVATARAGNVIGGGDWAKDRIVPDIIRALQSQQSVVIRNPAAIRPWQHVLEPLAGYLLLGASLSAEPGKFEGAWNFGPRENDKLTVGELARHALTCWGAGDIDFSSLADQPHEAGLLTLDIHKSLNKLNWQPRMNSFEAIKQTIEWYKKVTENNALELMGSQIRQYEETE